MITGYTYRLMKKNKHVGNYHSLYPLRGESITQREISRFRQKYGQRVKYIKCPLKLIFVKDDGVLITWERVIDVTKKSKRQIDILKEGHKW